MCEAQRCHKTESLADQCHGRTLQQHQLHHVAWLRPERETNADFVRSLSRNVGDDTINSDTREHQRQCREHAEQNHRESLAAREFEISAFTDFSSYITCSLFIF